MSQDYELYLRDILAAIGRVRRYTAGMSLNAFEADEKTMDAVMRNLEIIGEAAKAVPEPVRAANPDIEWRKMARFRDILIHHYFGVDPAVVYDIAVNKLEPLEAGVRSILGESSDGLVD